MLDEWNWIANPLCFDPGEPERKLIDNRSRLVVHGEVSDAEANYSFDDYALVSLDGDYYLLNTSGCSCPNPSEVWGVSEGPCSLDEMEQIFLKFPGSPEGYGVTFRQRGEFLQMIENARKAQ